jgi:hypothetical protein
LPISTSRESSTSPPLPLSPTVLTKKTQKKKTFSSSISVVVPSMSLSSQLKMVFSKLSQLTDTLIWVEKILTTDSSSSAWLNSRKRVVSTSRETTELSVVLELNAKRPRELSLLLIKPLLSVRPSPMVKTSLSACPELSSKNSALINSENVWLPSKTPLRMPVSPRDRSTISFWLEVPPVFPRFNN